MQSTKRYRNPVKRCLIAKSNLIFLSRLNYSKEKLLSTDKTLFVKLQLSVYFLGQGQANFCREPSFFSIHTRLIAFGSHISFTKITHIINFNFYYPQILKADNLLSVNLRAVHQKATRIFRFYNPRQTNETEMQSSEVQISHPVKNPQH